MVFAIMYYQFGVRSGDDVERKAQLNELSNKHYHWSLDKVWDIASDVSIAAIQALTLMATHCRGFPKPGPAYLIATLAWNRAIEMNLHRAYLQSDEPTTLENELRKRTWWSLFMVVVMLYGRLGKPMPIHAEDIDVDYPAVVADEYLTEDGILEHEPSAGDCYWLVASAGFRLSFLFMEMWNNVYAVRQDPQHYVDSVRRVELKFQAYQRELPDELRPENCKPGSRVLATYLQGSSYEFLFCLRHPSRCATADPAFLAENYRISGDAARNMLKVASELARLKSLDTTWYQMAVYVAVVFTLLASQWERRTEITPSELAELKDQVGLGVSVISEILKYIGTYMLEARMSCCLSACLYLQNGRSRSHVGFISHRRRRLPHHEPDHLGHRPDAGEHRARHDLPARQPHIHTTILAPAARSPLQARRVQRSLDARRTRPSLVLQHASAHVEHVRPAAAATTATTTTNARPTLGLQHPQCPAAAAERREHQRRGLLLHLAPDLHQHGLLPDGLPRARLHRRPHARGGHGTRQRGGLPPQRRGRGRAARRPVAPLPVRDLDSGSQRRRRRRRADGRIAAARAGSPQHGWGWWVRACGRGGPAAAAGGLVAASPSSPATTTAAASPTSPTPAPAPAPSAAPTASFSPAAAAAPPTPPTATAVDAGRAGRRRGGEPVERLDERHGGPGDAEPVRRQRAADAGRRGPGAEGRPGGRRNRRGDGRGRRSGWAERPVAHVGLSATERVWGLMKRGWRVCARDSVPGVGSWG